MEKLPDTGAGAGRGKQGGPTAKEIEYRNSEAYVSPDAQEAMKHDAEFTKYSAENKSQKIMKHGGKVSASKRADGAIRRGHTKGTYK